MTYYISGYPGVSDPRPAFTVLLIKKPTPLYHNTIIFNKLYTPYIHTPHLVQHEIRLIISMITMRVNDIDHDIRVQLFNRC
ncbi:MAG: hypothetical protein ACJATP_003111 [Candidatus Azotimanducaceae bacterium]|jgi:hypothetical protein